MSVKEYTGADDTLKKIAGYPDDFRLVAEKMHETIMGTGVKLYPRLWYGMPGYAKTPTGPVLIYFRKDKYITFGKSQLARLDFDKDTHAATTAWAFTQINEASLAKITSIVQSTVGVA